MPPWGTQVKGGFCRFGSSLDVLDFAAFGFRLAFLEAALCVVCLVPVGPFLVPLAG